MFDWMKNSPAKILFLLFTVFVWTHQSAYAVTHRPAKSARTTQTKKIASSHTTARKVHANAKPTTYSKKSNKPVRVASTSKKKTTLRSAATPSTQASTSETVSVQNAASTHLPGYLLSTIEKNL